MLILKLQDYSSCNFFCFLMFSIIKHNLKALFNGCIN